jgi:hypothetical protein
MKQEQIKLILACLDLQGLGHSRFKPRADVQATKHIAVTVSNIDCYRDFWTDLECLE